MFKVNGLKKKYPCFVYESYSWKIVKNDLKIFFSFKIESIYSQIGPDIEFHPEITIKNINKKRLVRVGDCALNNLIFNIGLIEIPSYWKTTCSPEIVIKAGYLDSEQIKWWQDLIINGMGQYFYENKINFAKPDFLTIVSAGTIPVCRFDENLQNKYLVPMGGGKDSIVTLEKLRAKNKNINCFLLNPSLAAKKVIQVAGIKNPIVIERKIDPILLKMNKQGFLNGHTPFTALLSFLSVFAAVLFDFKFIAFSNEKSADEGNVEYLGHNINHQWSKSSEFEKKFKDYCQNYLTKNVNYFSFLRKSTELEISRMFTKFPQYFSVFSSCNVGIKKGMRWCGKCPKCLFVYMTLYPFLEKEEIIKIFGRDLYEDKNLLPLIKDLMGKGKFKPFECVGTFVETKLALRLSSQKAEKSGKVPFLLKEFARLQNV